MGLIDHQGSFTVLQPAQVELRVVMDLAVEVVVCALDVRHESPEVMRPRHTDVRRGDGESDLVRQRLPRLVRVAAPDKRVAMVAESAVCDRAKRQKKMQSALWKGGERKAVLRCAGLTVFYHHPPLPGSGSP